MDVAWEHVEWARHAGLRPQDVIAGCGATPERDQTWEFAMRLVAALYEGRGTMPVAKRAQFVIAPSRPMRLSKRGPPMRPEKDYTRPRPTLQYEVKDRTCMTNGCSTVFRSAGPHHRMCDRHRKAPNALPSGWEYVADSTHDEILRPKAAG